MGVYDTYGQAQIKVGQVTMENYSIGDKVPIKDGAYIALESIVIVSNGVFVAELPKDALYTKWGDRIESEKLIQWFHPLIPQPSHDVMVAAFDVDGTLLDADDKPYKQVVEFLKDLYKTGGYKIIVWSGGGKEYAQTWGRRLGLDEYVSSYHSKLEAKNLKVDIAFDDQPVKLATINMRVTYDENGVLKLELVY